MMLKMNLAHLTHDELVDAISHHCSQFGEVKAVDILKPPGHPEMAFALISMDSSDAVQRMVQELGAAEVDSLAVVRVEQETPGIPAFLRKAARDHASAAV